MEENPKNQKEEKPIFKKPEFYIGIAVGLLLFKIIMGLL